jgi:hypothetical protein
LSPGERHAASTWPFVIEHSAEKKEAQLKPWRFRLQDQALRLFDGFYAASYFTRLTPVTMAPGNISMTTRRASLDDSALTVILRPLPRIE